MSNADYICHVIRKNIIAREMIMEQTMSQSIAHAINSLQIILDEREGNPEYLVKEMVELNGMAVCDNY